jgi:hypothetical protein
MELVVGEKGHVGVDFAVERGWRECRLGGGRVEQGRLAANVEAGIVRENDTERD